MYLALRYYVGAAIFFGVPLYALWRGFWPERWTAVVVLLATLLTPLVVRYSRLADPQWGVALVDLVTFAALVALTHFSRRVWLLVAASVQGINAASHVALAIDPNIEALAYISSRIFWSYFVIACLFVGAFQADRHRRLYVRPTRP